MQKIIRVFLKLRGLFQSVAFCGYRGKSWSKVWKRLKGIIDLEVLTMTFEWNETAKKFPADLVKIELDLGEKHSVDYIFFFQEIARIIKDNDLASFENLMTIAFLIGRISSVTKSIKKKSPSDEVIDHMRAILPGSQSCMALGLTVSEEVSSYIKLPLFEELCELTLQMFHHAEHRGVSQIGEDGKEDLKEVIDVFENNLIRQQQMLLGLLDPLERKRIQRVVELHSESFSWLPRSMKYYFDLRNLGVTGEDSDPNFGSEEWKRHRILLQLGLIIFNNPSGSISTLMEIAFNVGQLSRTINRDPFFTKGMRKYFKVNKMDSIKGYFDFSPDSKL